MNLALLDSELFELPEMIEDRLQVSPDEVIVCTFNGRGNLLAGAIHFAAEGKIVTAKYFCACYQPCWKGLVMAVSYSYGPSPFKDASTGQGDIQNAKIALCIMTQGMGLFCHKKASASELIIDFTKHPVV